MVSLRLAIQAAYLQLVLRPSYELCGRSLYGERVTHSPSHRHSNTMQAIEQHPSIVKSYPIPKRRQRSRRGTTTIEFAIVAIPLFVLVMASIEFGRGMMAVQSLEEAARCGCRKAVLKGTTTADVETEVTQLMNLAGISSYTTQIEPASLSSVPQWDPVTVRVSANLGDSSWMPMPKFLAGLSYTASCILAREGAPE
jgi:hypothetical protein